MVRKQLSMFRMTGESWYKYYVMSSRVARGQLVLLTVRGDDRGDLDSISLFIHDLLRFYDMPVVFADRPAAIEFKLCNMRCRSEIKKLIHEGSKKGNPETAAVPLVWRVPSLAFAGPSRISSSSISVFSSLLMLH
jgi:hypothetical protein